VGDIHFKVISATENSNKFQKTRFWKEKSVENVVTLEGLPFNSSMISFSYLAVQKMDTCIAKQCSHVEFPFFFNGFTLGPTAQATLMLIKFDMSGFLI
jgi:hypothetical protein